MAIQYWKRQKLEWQTGQIFWLQFWPLPVGVWFAGLKCLTGCPAYQSCFSPKGSGWICPTGLFQIDLIGMPGLHRWPKTNKLNVNIFYSKWYQDEKSLQFIFFNVSGRKSEYIYSVISRQKRWLLNLPLIYSRLRNKHRGRLINFGLFSRGYVPY